MITVSKRIEITFSGEDIKMLTDVMELASLMIGKTGPPAAIGGYTKEQVRNLSHFIVRLEGEIGSV